MLNEERTSLGTDELYQAKKAQLPNSGVRYGAQAWCSDGRKQGEAAGSGTGVLVYFCAHCSAWLRFSDDSEVSI